MKFEPLPLTGAWLITAEPVEDERGSFSRIWCEAEAIQWGLNPRVVQCSRSFNRLKGTLRGMHFQVEPFEECKWIRCTQGKIFDVLIDLRRSSPSHGRWHALELRAEHPQTLYLPNGFAHGFMTLTDDAVVEYQISEPFHPQSAAGVRWNDPAFQIDWPMAPRVISPRDAQYPDYK